MGNGLVGWRGEERGGNEKKMKTRGATRVGLHPMSEIQKYAEGRADLIGGAATQTFASGGKHAGAAIVDVTMKL